MLRTAPAALGSLVLFSFLSKTISQHLEDVGSYERRHQRLAVLLPTSKSDTHGAQWPTRCSPAKTTQNVDLVLYVPPQQGSDYVGAHRSHLLQNHCFASVRTVYGSEVRARRVVPVEGFGGESRECGRLHMLVTKTALHQRIRKKK